MGCSWSVRSTSRPSVTRISTAPATSSWNCTWESWLARLDRQGAEAARDQVVDPGMGDAQRVVAREGRGIEAQFQPQAVQHGGEAERREMRVDLEAALARDLGNQFLETAAVVGI